MCGMVSVPHFLRFVLFGVHALFVCLMFNCCGQPELAEARRFACELEGDGHVRS